MAILLSVISVPWVITGCRKTAPGLGPLHHDASVRDTAGTAESLVGEVLTPGYPGAVEVTFEIRADRDVHAISPYIYGANTTGEPERQRWGLFRTGGNRSTAYNWETNASNAGSDYLFQNDSFVSESSAPAKPMLEMIDMASAVSAATIVTLSNADYVAADKNGGGDVRNSGPDYLSKRFKRNLPQKPGAFAASPDTTDDSVYQDELVAFLKAQRPKAKILFSMDNEPDLWAHTHAEIFPGAITYADLWKRNYAFAKGAKGAWPEAEVLGFVSFGYSGYTSLQNAPDAGGRNFIEWYLQQARAAHKKEGKRLIDYLDLHWYPEAAGAGGQRIVERNVTPEVVAAREQAPRSLWDARYTEKSWIADAVGGPIALIPRLRELINAHYPGTKLSFTEWNYGGGNHISGAIATSDVLGIFGREGVGAACFWPLIDDESFAWAAFRVFRNYDDNGSSFGDTSIAATSSDVSLASVYASIDSRDPTRTKVVVINKSTSSKRAGIKIAHSAVYSSAKVFLLLGLQPNLVAGPVLKAVASNAFAYDMPAQSISVIVPQ